MCKYTYIHITFIYMYILYILYRYTYTRVCIRKFSFTTLFLSVCKMSEF